MRHPHVTTTTLEELDAVLTIRAHEELADWVAWQATEGQRVALFGYTPHMSSQFIGRVATCLIQRGVACERCESKYVDGDGNQFPFFGLRVGDVKCQDWIPRIVACDLSVEAPMGVPDIVVLLHEDRSHTRYLDGRLISEIRSCELLGRSCQTIHGQVLVYNRLNSYDWTNPIVSLNQLSLWSES